MLLIVTLFGKLIVRTAAAPGEFAASPSGIAVPGLSEATLQSNPKVIFLETA
jgi:hypothetical protein